MIRASARLIAVIGKPLADLHRRFAERSLLRLFFGIDTDACIEQKHDDNACNNH